MWKVGDVEPVRVMGAEGYPDGFHVTTDDGKPLVSFAYAYSEPLPRLRRPPRIGSAEPSPLEHIALKLKDIRSPS